jgi:diguanylate cyclase (GGDEF)-like protein
MANQRISRSNVPVDDLFGAMLDVIPGEVCIIDSMGKIEYVSQQMVDICDCNVSDDLVNSNISKIFVEFGNIEGESILQKLSSNQTGIFTLQKENGNNQVQIKYNFIHNTLGKIDRIMLFIEDLQALDEKKRNEYASAHLNEALQKTALAINSTLDFDQLLNQILEQISHVISFDSASITLLDNDNFHLVAMKGFDKEDAVMGLWIPSYPEPTVICPNLQAIESKKSIRIGNIPLEYPYFIQPRNKTVHSWMGIPLFARNKGIGTLNLDSHTKNHFTDEDQKIGEIFAAQLSVALENAHLYTETKNQATEQSIINDVMHSTISHLGLQELIQSMDNKLSQYCRNTCFLIGLKEYETESWHPVYFRNDREKIVLEERYQLSDNIPGFVIQNQTTLSLKSEESIISFIQENKRNFFGIIPLSLIGVPLEVAGTLIGVMVCASLDPDNEISERKIEFFKLLGQQISIAFQNANLYSELEHKASIDNLTGLLNRVHFLQLANIAITHFDPSKYPISLIMLDIDFYKDVNDSYGHILGDKVLISLAQVCQKQMREMDVIGRYGGDEFVILLPNTKIENAALVAQRLCDAISRQIICAEVFEVRITASLGISDFKTGDTIETLINRADTALYTAKQKGRNQVEVYSVND